MLEEIPIRMGSWEVLNLIHSGKIKSGHLGLLKASMNLNDDTISFFLSINVKTYRAYKNNSVSIKEDLQEHVVMLLSLVKHGVEIFGSNDNFNKWLTTKNFQLGKKPIEYLNTINGIKLVDDRLTGIEYGDNV